MLTNDLIVRAESKQLDSYIARAKRSFEITISAPMAAKSDLIGARTFLYMVAMPCW